VWLRHPAISISATIAVALPPSTHVASKSTRPAGPQVVVELERTWTLGGENGVTHGHYRIQH